MAWIRFWSSTRCASGHNEPESQYVWLDDPMGAAQRTDAELEDYARELVPRWLEGSERGFRYGFERIAELPEPERLKQIAFYEGQIAYSAKMLRLLR